MANSTIITGQFVRIEQTPASIGERILALIIDYVLISIYLFSTTYIFYETITTYTPSIVVYLVCIYFPAFFYFLLCEVFNRGQSVGKKIMNIRVVKVDGSTPGISAYMLRWLLFVIDGPLTGGLGFIVILLTKNNQRLGDLAAGTMVLKENSYRKIHVSLDEFDYLSKTYRPTYPQAIDLSLEQIDVITRTLESNKKDKAHRVAALSQKVQQLLAIRAREDDQEEFLRVILRDYQYYALEELVS